MEREDIKMLVAKWWDIYNDKSLDFKAEDSVPEGEGFSRPSIMASMPEPAISYIPAPSAAWRLQIFRRECVEAQGVIYLFFYLIPFPKATWSLFFFSRT